MKSFKGKKLLILGGAFQHCKLVEAAKEMGIVTYVTDYLPLESAPAKQIADHYAMHNITDIDEIVDYCKREDIDGVMAMCLDACQIPYQKVCEKLNVPCFGNAEQFKILTDKTVFKKYCQKNGVDTIPEYSTEDFASTIDSDAEVEYPVLVKPCISRGSRGSTVCFDRQEVILAIKKAEQESANGKVLIEKYMGNKNDICVTYIVINGEVYLTRVGDRRLGRIEDKMERVSMLGMAPSKYIDMYVNNVNPRVIKMIKSLGIINGPVFMQGFVDGSTVRFYDPGLRYPGAEYERVYDKVHGVSLIKPLIEFALSGEITYHNDIPVDGYMQRNKKTPYLLISIKPGQITKIEGLEKIKQNPSVISIFEKYKVGDVVGEHYNVNQRFCEIDLMCDDINSLCKTIDWIYDELKIFDQNGENMVFSKVKTSELMREYR